MANEEYLGDGLYVSFDGWQFCLRAPRENGDHVVYLEPYALKQFNDYAARATSPRMPEDLSDGLPHLNRNE